MWIRLVSYTGHVHRDPSDSISPVKRRDQHQMKSLIGRVRIVTVTV